MPARPGSFPRPAPLASPGRPPLDLCGRDRPAVMGILNLTPDSFSDGGRLEDPHAAVQQALGMAAAGADLLDLGAESTRPGAGRVPEDEQLRRLLPALAAVRTALDEHGHQGVWISVDTTRAAVAEAALHAGAQWVNDVSGGLDDPELLPCCARHQVPVVLMHWRGDPATMHHRASYEDVVGEVLGHLRQRRQAALDAGLPAGQVVLDPGIGFAKTTAHNLELLAALPRLVEELHPQALLVGASRKRFIADLHPPAAAAGDRGPGTGVVTTLATLAGVAAVRVHDVGPQVQARDVAAGVAAAGWPGTPRPET